MSEIDDLTAFTGERYGEAEQEVSDGDWMGLPERRLADIKLKRAILAAHPHTADTLWACWICGFDAEEGRKDRKHWCATVRQLGTEFASHPAYKAEWVPQA